MGYDSIMKRPKLPKIPRWSIGVPEQLHTKVCELAKKNRSTMRSVLEAAIREFSKWSELDQMESIREMELARIDERLNRSDVGQTPAPVQ